MTSLSQALAVAGVQARELLRDPAVLLLTLLLPVGFFYAASAYYSHDPRPAAWTVASTEEAEAARPDFFAALAKERHPDGRAAFELRDAGSDGERTADVRIRAGSSRDGLEFSGNALSLSFTAATNRMYSVLAELEGRTPVVVSAPPPFRGPPSDFAAYAPGILVLGVLFLIPQTACLVGRDRRRMTLDRMVLAGVPPAGYLGGTAIVQTGCAVVLALITAVLLASEGVVPRGGPAAAVAAMAATAALFGVGCVAQGLLVGIFVKSDSSALNAGSMLCMAQYFFSGAAFPIPSPALVEIGTPGSPGYFLVGAYDTFPAVHAMAALRRFLYDSPAAALPPLAAMAALSVAYFAAAAVLFARRAGGR